MVSITNTLEDAANVGLAQMFRRVGWVGFWVQLVIGALPILIGGIILLSSRTINLPGGRTTIIGFFSLASLIILLFTVFWFWRYTRLGRGLANRDSKWTTKSLARNVWIGLGASSIGILLSTIVLIVEVAFLLVRFLEAPQGGLPVIQTTAADGTANWISAIDIMSLMALILTVAAEIVVLVLGLWLLYRVTLQSRAAPGTA